MGQLVITTVSAFLLLWLMDSTQSRNYQSMDDLTDFPNREYTVKLNGRPDAAGQAEIEFFRHERYRNVCVKTHMDRWETPWGEIEILQYLNARNSEFVPKLLAVHKRTTRKGTFVAMVMSYIDGQTLGQLVANAEDANSNEITVDDVDIPSLMEKLLAAEKRLHDVGIVHRDIAMRNVMVDKRGRLYIIDFGLATFLQKNQVIVQSPRPYDRRGKMKGNRYYYAPETVFIEKVHELADETNLSPAISKARKKFFSDIYTVQFQGRPGDVWAAFAVFVSLLERLPDGPFAPPARPPPGRPLSPEESLQQRIADNNIAFANIVNGFQFFKPVLTQWSEYEVACRGFVQDPFKRPTAGEARDLIEHWLKPHGIIFKRQ